MVDNKYFEQAAKQEIEKTLKLKDYTSVIPSTLAAELMCSFHTIDVKFVLINDEEKQIKGILPKRAEELSTGYDVFNSGPDIELQPMEHKLIPLGFKSFIPIGYWLYLVPRSSTHAKRHLHTLYGVIDESYEGQWYFSAQYVPNWTMSKGTGGPVTIAHGDAIGQIIVMPRYNMNISEVTSEEYDALCKDRGALRGAGGFGSTGVK